MRSIGVHQRERGGGQADLGPERGGGDRAGGERVLVIDTDPQGNASHVLLAGGEAAAADGPRGPDRRRRTPTRRSCRRTSTAWTCSRPMPALADATVVLAAEVGRERRLREALAGLGEGYDFVLVDTAPTRSLLTTERPERGARADRPVHARPVRRAGPAAGRPRVVDGRGVGVPHSVRRYRSSILGRVTSRA